MSYMFYNASNFNREIWTLDVFGKVIRQYDNFDTAFIKFPTFYNLSEIAITDAFGIDYKEKFYLRLYKHENNELFDPIIFQEDLSDNKYYHAYKLNTEQQDLLIEIAKVWTPNISTIKEASLKNRSVQFTILLSNYRKWDVSNVKNMDKNVFWCK